MIGKEKIWAIFSLVFLVTIFIILIHIDSIISAYTTSSLGQFGLHHFLAFILAISVGSYVIKTKKNMGQIGYAIANPIIVALWVLDIQHF